MPPYKTPFTQTMIFCQLKLDSYVMQPCILNTSLESEKNSILFYFCDCYSSHKQHIAPYWIYEDNLLF